MAHDVFVSYASEDKATADALVETLEQRLIRCWIAPRDVPPDRNYAEALREAIGQARVLVLLFSHHSNTSPPLETEVELAQSKGIPIVALRSEDAAPSVSLERVTSGAHWLDASAAPSGEGFEELIETVQRILAGVQQAAPTREEPAPVAGRTVPQSGPPSWFASFWAWMTGGSKWRLAGVIGGAVIAVIIVFALIDGPEPPPPEPTPAPRVAPTPTILEEAPFLVQPETTETRWFDVETPSTVELRWTSTNRGWTNDGAPGEVDAYLTGPGGFNVFWERLKEKTAAFNAAPGRYTFTFDNWFSDFSSKQIVIRVEITPQ